jgi:outer membrane protein assembly factor BamE (lipoprotein component of BamABCDE complex)
MKRLIAIATLCVLGTGCTSAARHQQDVTFENEEQLTVAAVQRSIREGMSGAEVLASLGSPNIISTDENRNEVWVYDRVGTEYVYSESGTGLISLIGAASGAIAGGVGPGFEQRSGARRRSQRTLTITVHFDADQRVSDFSYHASRF